MQMTDGIKFTNHEAAVQTGGKYMAFFFFSPQC